MTPVLLQLLVLYTAAVVVRAASPPCDGEWIVRATGDGYCELHVHSVTTDAFLVPLMSAVMVVLAALYMTLAMKDQSARHLIDDGHRDDERSERLQPSTRGDR